MAAPPVFTIAAGTAFADALAAGIRAQAGDTPESLSQVRVLLPNRRACRALMMAFLRLSGGAPLLLPRMIPFGDLDDDELAFAETDALDAGDALAVPPAIPPLRRQLLLTRLVLAARGAGTPFDQAARLARELARLLDQLHIERLDAGALDTLAGEAYAEHWQRTLDVLRIVTQRWPSILAEEGCIDLADRRNRLLAAQARAWTTQPPATPVIAAGSTGSIPATADLIAVVARLPAGAVVLPGLDLDADEAEWQAIAEDPAHPQYGMARLLARLGVPRSAVRPWPAAAGAAASSPDRVRLLSRALAPADCADPLAARAALPPTATVGLHRLVAPGPAEEARAVALILREALETPGRTAALVTADRTLARYVAAELRRWRIDVDDTAGEPLANTVPAVFFRLIAAAVADELAPVPILALLKHPLAAAGVSPVSCRRMTRRLDREKLRGLRPAPGLPGLEAKVADDAGLVRFLDAVRQALQPLLRICAHGAAPLAEIVAGHCAAAEALAATDDEPGAARLWAGDAGESLAQFVREVTDAADAGAGLPAVAVADYPDLLDELMAGRVVRPAFGRHPRLAIWGPLEARLQQADVVVLGGLNEGSWPPESAANPWMSRPMMRALGLPLPERRIGLSAHDFVQACAAPNVWLTRARRRDGAPATVSRWLMRLQTVLTGDQAQALDAAGEDILAWQQRLDQPARSVTIAPPEPKPPVAARPRALSVTEVETWVRDPYALYARKILGLKALDPLDADPDGADFGSFVHAALERFVRETPGPLPEDALARLLHCGDAVFGNTPLPVGVRSFWWPRFEQICRWFLQAERRRRGDVRATKTEVKGALVLEAAGGSFELTARADRIDTGADGRLGIIDYKTGAAPSAKQVAAGFAPQLPLEALIAERGRFDGVPAAAVAALEYWQLKASGGKIERFAEGNARRPAAALLTERAEAQLHALIDAYDDATTPYRSQPRPRYAPRFSDFEHLARIKEWSVIAPEEAD